MATEIATTKKTFTIVTISYFLHELYEETPKGRELVDVQNFIKPLEDLVERKGGEILNKREKFSSNGIF